MNFEKINKFNSLTVSKIIEEIEVFIKEKVGTFYANIKNDNEKFSEKFEYSKLIDVLNRLKKEPWLMKYSSKNEITEGIGTLGLIYNGQPDLLLYMAIKALKTHNKLIIFEEFNIHKTSKMILDAINTICEKNNYDNHIDYKEYQRDIEILNYKEHINKIIIVNNYDKYQNLKQSIKSENIIYSSFGKLDLYLDDEDMKNVLLQIDDFVFNNNIEINIIKDKDIKIAIEKINKNFKNFCVVIFTKDSKKAYTFIEQVKSEKIFVNQSPIKEYIFNLEDEKITYNKKIYI